MYGNKEIVVQINYNKKRDVTTATVGKVKAAKRGSGLQNRA